MCNNFATDQFKRTKLTGCPLEKIQHDFVSTRYGPRRVRKPFRTAPGAVHHTSSFFLFFSSPTFLSQNVTKFSVPLRIFWRASHCFHVLEICPHPLFRVSWGRVNFNLMSMKSRIMHTVSQNLDCMYSLLEDTLSLTWIWKFQILQKQGGFERKWRIFTIFLPPNIFTIFEYRPFDNIVNI